MSLIDQIVSLAQAIAADIKSLNTNKVTVESGKGLSPITKEYISGELDVTAGATASFAHGLGGTPKFLSMALVCKVADSFGYSVGDEISLGQVYTGIAYGTDVGIQSMSNTTNVRYKVAEEGAAITNINSGQPSLIDPTHYKLVIRAYA